MALPQPLHEGHEILGEEDYCSGYKDAFGKWNTGFSCPVLDENEPVFCCGTESIKYCCVKPKTLVSPPITHLALLLGVIFGVAVAVAVVVVVSCFHCSCCLLYKKRQPIAGGTVYQMHCPSQASGVANMYSFSGMTTPSDTPRSNSRGSSSSRSRITNESGPSTISYSVYDINDMRSRSEMLSQPHTYSSVTNSRPGSIAFSDQSASTLSDITVRENVLHADRGRLGLGPFDPPPPYNSPPSTLVAMRTSSSFPSPTSVPQPHTPPSLLPQGDSREASVFPGGMVGDDSSLMSNQQLRTFSAPVLPPPASLAAVRLATSMRSTTQPTSQAQHQHFTHTHHNQPLHSHTLANHYVNLPQSYSNQTYSLNQPIVRPVSSSITAISRPTSTNHIVTSRNSTLDDRRLFSATKF